MNYQVNSKHEKPSVGIDIGVNKSVFGSSRCTWNYYSKCRVKTQVILQKSMDGKVRIFFRLLSHIGGVEK